MKIRRPWSLASNRSIIVVLTQYHVKISYQDKFLGVLSEYTISSLSATGNIMAAAYYEQGDACIMWTIERWDDQANYKNNRESAAAKEVGALARTGLASPVETIFMEDLELHSKQTGHNAITIMLMVDVKDGTEDLFISLNHEVMSSLRHEPGVLSFQLSQVVRHKTRFIIYKKFRNWDAFQYHLKDPVLGPVLEFLQTSIKEPPFEKGYHHLIQFAPL
jgi:quinol monooxygenase YgiN